IDTCARSVIFTNSSQNATTYLWNFGDATTSTLANPTHTYSASGTYNVSLIATTAAGCHDTIIHPVPVSFTLPVAAFTPNPTVCTYTVSFTNQSTGANNYAWTFGDASTSTAANPSHAYASPGNYVVTLFIH